MRAHPTSRYRANFEYYVRLITIIMGKHRDRQRMREKNIINESLLYVSDRLRQRSITLYSGVKVNTESRQSNFMLFQIFSSVCVHNFIACIMYVHKENLDNQNIFHNSYMYFFLHNFYSYLFKRDLSHLAFSPFAHLPLFHLKKCNKIPCF